MKKKIEKCCLVWGGYFNDQNITLEKAEKQATDDLLNGAVDTVYICKIIKKIVRTIKITDM